MDPFSVMLLILGSESVAKAPRGYGRERTCRNAECCLLCMAGNLCFPVDKLAENALLTSTLSSVNL